MVDVIPNAVYQLLFMIAKYLMHTIIVECLGFNLGNHLVNKLRHAQDRVLHIVCKYKKFHAFPEFMQKIPR